MLRSVITSGSKQRLILCKTMFPFVNNLCICLLYIVMNSCPQYYSKYHWVMHLYHSCTPKWNKNLFKTVALLWFSEDTTFQPGKQMNWLVFLLPLDQPFQQYSGQLFSFPSAFNSYKQINYDNGASFIVYGLIDHEWIITEMAYFEGN